MLGKVIKANQFCVNKTDLLRLQGADSSQEQEKILIELMKESNCNRTDERIYWIGFDECLDCNQDIHSNNEHKIVHKWPNSTLEPKEIVSKPYHIFTVDNFDENYFDKIDFDETDFYSYSYS